MVKKKSRHPIQARTTPFYSLSAAKGLITNGKFRIPEDVRRDARNAFGWGLSDMVDVLMKLQIKHFYKTERSNFEPHFPIDVYKARGLKGENVHTHFYIDNEANCLFIQSLKEI